MRVPREIPLVATVEEPGVNRRRKREHDEEHRQEGSAGTGETPGTPAHRVTTTSRAPAGTGTRCSPPPGHRTHTADGVAERPKTWPAPFSDQYPDPASISRTGPMWSP